MGYSPRGCNVSDKTKQLSAQVSFKLQKKKKKKPILDWHTQNITIPEELKSSSENPYLTYLYFINYENIIIPVTFSFWQILQHIQHEFIDLQ